MSSSREPFGALSALLDPKVQSAVHLILSTCAEAGLPPPKKRRRETVHGAEAAAVAEGLPQGGGARAAKGSSGSKPAAQSAAKPAAAAAQPPTASQPARASAGAEGAPSDSGEQHGADVASLARQESKGGEREREGKAKLPPIAAMRAVGYLESSDTMQRLWAWAKEHQPQDGVWPTPVSHQEEALTFDACGWPSEHSTPEEWLQMLQYWTCLREQLIGGLPRRCRR